MSAKKCIEEIRHFLASDQAQVLVVSGKWGVGKTFAWNHTLEEAKASKSICFGHYSYVSLFGLCSIGEVKDALFHSARPVEKIGEKLSLTSLADSIEAIKSNWRKAGFWAKMLPQTEGYAAFATSIGYLLLNSHIVCIDDLERRGNALAPIDILGLVSQLKEEKRCKVVLLLNERELGEQETEFFKHLEKVADTTVSFEPTSTEATSIALDNTHSYHERLSECCASLNIVNIRTINKIEAALARIESELGNIDPRVMGQAAHSLALFLFCRLHPNEAPALEFISNRNPWEDILADKDSNLPNAKWRDFLQNYNFGDIDEFDVLLIDGVNKGYFDFDALRREANKLSETFLLRDADDSFSEAWDYYHDSFDDNADEVMTRFAAAIERTPKVISPTNLSGTISALKDLGWKGDVNQLIQSYVNGRDEDSEFWNLDDQTFGDQVRDEDVRAAFNAKYESYPEVRDLKDTLVKWASKSGYNFSDVDFVATFNEEAFYDLFKGLRGKELDRAIRGALWFRVSTIDKQRKIAETAEAALIKIGNESPINRRRVIQDGVKMPE